MTTGPVHVVSYALSPEEAALVRLGSALKEAGYSYVTVTPEAHRRVSGRPENAEARDLRDVFGWSRPFRNRIGDVVLQLKTAYRDGTTHVMMSPLEFMQRLAALVPRPRLHLIRVHGVLAPNAKHRSAIIP